MARQGDKYDGGDGERRPAGFEAMKRRPVIAERHKELMMTILVRNRRAFEAVRELLTVDHFGDFDLGYATVWRLVNDYYADHQTLPESEFLKASVEAAVESNPGLLNDAEYDKLNAFLEFVEDPGLKQDVDTSDEYTKWAVKTATRFLEERLALRLKEAVQSRDMVPADMPSIMAQMAAEADMIAATTSETHDDSFPDDWHRTSQLKLFSTGIGFIDEFLGGGQAPGEVYGLMGPYGSCKTTLVSQLGVEAAKAFNEEANENADDADYRPKLAFIVSYEARRPEMRNRTIGYAARVIRSTMESLDPLKPLEQSGLSHTGNLKEYEKQLFRKKIRDGETVPGECERAVSATNVLRRHLILLDMTGAEKKGVGNGGVKEIARAINQICRQRKARCGWVGVDYVGAMVKRYMAAENIGNDQLRHLVGSAPLTLKSQVADVFDCPVWALHQLAGNANSFSPAVLADHTDAAEAKNFGENLDFAFTASKPQEPDNVALFGCTKHRRTEGKQAVVIKIKGAFNRVDGASHEYRLNGHARKIMKIEDWNNMPENAKQKAVAKASGGSTATAAAAVNPMLDDDGVE